MNASASATRRPLKMCTAAPGTSTRTKIRAGLAPMFWAAQIHNGSTARTP